MRSREYWAKRFKALEERSNKEAQKCVAESMKLLDEAVIQIDKDITYWLKRFAINSNMSLSEAKKAITNKELGELGWDVEEYIRKGRANSYTGEWTTELENASARYHITRLDAIKLQIQKFCDKAFTDIVDSMNMRLSNVYRDVYYRTAFEAQKGIGVGYSFAQVDERKLKMILERPWAVDGTNFSQRVWGTYRPKLTNKLQQALTDWCVRGTDPKKLAQKLSYESGIVKSACSRLIHTETAQICTRAEMDSYDELGVDKYRILETLDGKTCDICGSMDSKIFNKRDYEVGVTAPPFHPNCRGTTVPEVDDELLKKGRKRVARDLKTGKTVYIDDMSYKEWKEKFVGNDQFTNISNNDIIKSEREMANGLRTSATHVLTGSEIESIKRDAATIKVPDNILRFNEGTYTGFSDDDVCIYVKGDILPDINSVNNRDLLSQRAVLAHEYYGHFKAHPSNFRVGDWRDEFRASYRAALDTPGLNDSERAMLMVDAYERAKEAGVSVRYNAKARRIIYGYE